jgi:hypothetical protein
MRKIVSLFVVAGLTAASLIAAQAFAAGPPYGWRFTGPPSFYYYQDKQLDRATIEKKAKAILDTASKGESWMSPGGVTVIPILGKDKSVVGNLWQDADLKRLGVGVYWTAPFGTRIDLVADGRAVGMLWVQ